MDAVAGLLDGPRARGAFLLRSSMNPPWSLLIRDEAPLCLVAVVKGHAWVAGTLLEAGGGGGGGGTLARGGARRGRPRPRPLVRRRRAGPRADDAHTPRRALRDARRRRGQ